MVDDMDVDIIHWETGWKKHTEQQRLQTYYINNICRERNRSDTLWAILYAILHHTHAHSSGTALDLKLK